jgi:O-antigen/teichoic acid export membrane protein
MTGVAEVVGQNVLLKRASRAMFWNASMLPVITVVNLAAAVMIRRGFGLQSGIYDVALGVLNTLLAYSEIGLPASVNQFVPGLERTAGRHDVVQFLRRVVPLRMGLLLVALVPFNIFAPQLAARLHLGGDGVWLLRIVSVLAIFRASSDLAIQTLQALLAHLMANVVQLALALALVGVVMWTLLTGSSISSLLFGLAVASIVVSVVSAGFAWRQVSSVAIGPASSTAGTATVPWSRLWRFAVFMYVFEVSNYFAAPAFASPALAAASSGAAIVALFNVAFQFPMMVVVVILAGFQGLYRPLFAGVLAENAPERIRTVFSEISKVQAILLIPAGVGLGLMLPDYITLLFTKQFANAAPLARVLCAFLFVEALLNLGNILLSVDHRYVPSLAAQALRIVGAPLFVWLAVRGDMLLATAVFGAGRVLAAALGFFVARRLYGVQFPVAFAARVCLSTILMGLTVGVGRLVLPASWFSTGLLTLLGAALVVLGMRWFRVLGPREIDLLRRARLPGRSIILRWFPSV